MIATTLAGTFRRSSRSGRAAGLISEAKKTVMFWHARARDRQELAGLNDRMLRDIGLTRADVEYEHRKHF
jgi:uncharacterized protein YjiS (DUF1127 family)